MAGLLRWVVGVGLIVVAAVDGASIAMTAVSLDDAARTAGIEAVDSVRSTSDGNTTPQVAVQQAYDAATASLAGHGGGEIDAATFVVHTDGSVSFTTTRRAPTLLLGRLGPTRDWAEIDVEMNTNRPIL
jgi:hypothetical protein